MRVLLDPVLQNWEELILDDWVLVVIVDFIKQVATVVLQLRNQDLSRALLVRSRVLLILFVEMNNFLLIFLLHVLLSLFMELTVESKHHLIELLDFLLFLLISPVRGLR